MTQVTCLMQMEICFVVAVSYYVLLQGINFHKWVSWEQLFQA